MTKEAQEVSAKSKAAFDKMQDQLGGKSLVTLATTAVGYLGITKVPSVFPVPSGWEWLLGLTFALLAAMAGIVGTSAWRLQRAKRPMYMRSEVSEIPDLSENERAEVKGLFDRYAAVNKQQSLKDYEDLGLQIAAAHESGNGSSLMLKEPLSRATQIGAEVQCAHQRAATLVLRRRMTTVTGGLVTMVSVVVFILAGCAVFVATDKLNEVREIQKSQVSGRLSTIKECADAIAAKRSNPVIALALPAECGPNA